MFETASKGRCFRPDLLQTYLRYKKGTAIIAAWMKEAAGEKQLIPGTISSIPDLWRLARILQSKKTVVPSHIRSIFRHTVSARNSLSKYFKPKDTGSMTDVNNLTHEYFTSSLSQIYTFLCGIDQKVGAPENNKSTSNSVRSKPSAKNTFSALDGHVEQEYDAVLDENTENFYRCHGTAEDSGSKADSFHLVGDELGNALELLQSLEDMNNIYMAMRVSWEQVCQGYVHIMIGSTALDRGLRAIRELEDRLVEVLGPQTPSELLEMYHSVKGAMVQDAGDSDETATRTSLPFLDDLQEPWAGLVSYKELLQARFKGTCLPETGRLDKPKLSDLNKMFDPDPFVFHGSIQDVILTILANRHGVENAPLETDYDKLEFEIHKSLHKGAEEDLHPLANTFGLLTIQWTYKRYVNPKSMDEPASRKFPRLSYLRLVQEADASLEKTIRDGSMPICRCHQTLKAFLLDRRALLRPLLEDNRFDLLGQSPWGAGADMNKLIFPIYWLSLRLCSYRGIVGSVLYTYQALRAVDKMEPIPALEAICNLLTKSVFMGERPKENFMSRYIRFNGGRIKFGQHGRGSADHSSWEMTLPNRAEKPMPYGAIGLRTSVNDERFHLSKICNYWQYYMGASPSIRDDWQDIFTQSTKERSAKGKAKSALGQEWASILQSNHVSASERSRRDSDSASQSSKSSSATSTNSKDTAITSPSSTSSGSVSDHHKLPNPISHSATSSPSRPPPPHQQQHQTPHALSTFQEIMNTDFTGDLPSSLTNFFTLYNSCSKVTHRIATRSHDDPKESYCVCFAKLILRKVDEYVDNGLVDKCCAKKQNRAYRRWAKKQGILLDEGGGIGGAAHKATDCETWECDEVVREARDAIRREFGGKMNGDYLWSI